MEGKDTLIYSVLQSIPIHILSVIVPSKFFLKELQKDFATFVLNNKETGNSKHRVAWVDIYLPKEEGGLGFRYFFDVSKAMFAKLWCKSKLKIPYGQI